MAFSETRLFLENHWRDLAQKYFCISVTGVKIVLSCEHCYKLAENRFSANKQNLYKFVHVAMATVHTKAQ